jgi:hypothetical protein
LQIGFNQFLLPESKTLMSIEDLSDFKAQTIDLFRGILHHTVMASLRTTSQIPSWAAAKVAEGRQIYQYIGVVE